MSVLEKLIQPIPKASQRLWRLMVDGLELIPDHFELTSSFGTLRFGLNPVVGKDAFAFEESGGGGSVLVPFFISHDAELYVGIVQQPRPFMSDEPVWNLPRGFLKPGSTHFKTVAREGAEELGLIQSDRVFLLPGAPGNPNSSFFVTRGVTADGTPKGLRYYAVEFTSDEVEKSGSLYHLKPGVVQPVTPAAEGIMASCFVHWNSAAGLSCLITNAGVARLMATKSPLIVR